MIIEVPLFSVFNRGSNDNVKLYSDRVLYIYIYIL